MQPPLTLGNTWPQMQHDHKEAILMCQTVAQCMPDAAPSWPVGHTRYRLGRGAELMPFDLSLHRLALKLHVVAPDGPTIMRTPPRNISPTKFAPSVPLH